jgi:hypothetical protein
MANVELYNNATQRLAAQADAVGRLAQDAGAFAATVAAFESRDPNAFRWVLERLELIPHCELICEWIEIKLCALRCIEVCGPPIEEEPELSLRQFAEVVVRLAANERMLRRVVDAVSCGDAEAYRAAIRELNLEIYCHYICRWVCSAIYRRVCEFVCQPVNFPLPDPVADLRAAAAQMEHVLKNERGAEAVSRAAEALDCIITRQAIGEAGFGPYCEVFCWVFCVWRCVRVCWTLCRRPPIVVTGPLAIEEARNFALAARALSAQPRLLFDLVTAVQARDPLGYEEIVTRFALWPYCYQLCGWVCSITCSEFCICICPNQGLQPWFTTVGYFDINTDIDPGSGLTNKGLPFPSLTSHGGPNFAFYGQLQLGGFCPATSPVFSGVPMKYRFTFDKGGGPVPITQALVSPVQAGQRLIPWPTKDGAGNATSTLTNTFQDVWIQAAPVPPDPTPPAPTTHWVPPTPHYIVPDADGWVDVDPNAIGGGFSVLMGFDTTGPVVAQGQNPNPAVTAGSAVPVADQGAGTDMSIIFEATRTTVLTVDYSNSLSKIHVNNWTEVNQLNFAEFVTGCCTPIDKTLSVQFTVDHEEMAAGGWSLGISSCSPSAPGDITPHVSSGGVTVDARGGWGTIVEDTSTWENCSYTVSLVTRPGLTTGLADRLAWVNSLTFAICNH